MAPYKKKVRLHVRLENVHNTKLTAGGNVIVGGRFENKDEYAPEWDVT